MEAVKVFKVHPDAIVPSRKGTDNAGYDLHTIEDFSLHQGERAVVRTGLVIQPPPGYHTEILLRSSLAYKHNIILINSVGLVDRSYAGPTDELRVMLYKLPWLGLSRELSEPVAFEAGDRVAQLVFRKSELLEIEEVAEAPGTDRGGFGSTGK